MASQTTSIIETTSTAKDSTMDVDISGPVDVIVIGAGLSGITCAEEILKSYPAYKVLVLEGSERVGGRTKTISFTADNDPTRSFTVDAGGMWLGPTHENMLQNCERFGVETVPQYYEIGKHVLARGTPKSRHAYKGDIPPYSVLSLLEIQFSLLNRMDSYMKQVPLDEPWKSPYAKEWDAHSVSSFMASRLWTSGAKEVVELVCWALLGSQATQVSFLFFLWFARACEGLKMLTDATGGAQDRTMKGGSQQISQKLQEAAEKLGARFRFQSRVSRISCVNSTTGHIMSVECSDGSKYQSKVVVSAGLASTFLRNCHFAQNLPGEIARFSNTTFRGTYAKAVVIYETAWWREAGYSGMMTNTKPSREACAAFGYDYSEAGRSALVVFITADVGAEVGSLTEEARKESVLNSFRLFFPKHEKEIGSYISYHDEFWQYNEFANGGPMTVYPPGMFAPYSTTKLLRKPLIISGAKRPCLFFAGTDVSTRWTGYMEGACVRGKEVAAQVVQALKHQEDSFEIQHVEEARWTYANVGQ